MSQQSEVETHAKRRRPGALWVQAPFLFGLWLLLSGKFDAFHMTAGVLGVAFVIWLDRRLEPANLGKGDDPVRLNLVKLLWYIPWLMGQMLLSSLHVARVILSPAMPLDPVLVSFTSAQPHSFARVLLGNSITLTPGTLTLNIDGDRYLVHALGPASTQGLISGDMQRKVARLFGASAEGAISNTMVEPRKIRGGIRG